MNKSQKNLLKLLKEIDAICKEININYYAAGGTVIGAVRHEGFIPWDDDIDIYMTRDHWLKFKKYFAENRPESRVLECWENNKGYHNLLARYMDVETTAIYRYQIYDDADMGQLIDIFLLDPMVSSRQETEDYSKNVMLLSDLMCEYIFYSKRQPSCDEYEKLTEQMEREGRDLVIEKVLKRLEKFEEKDADCYMLRWGGLPHIFPKEMFQHPRYGMFEDLEIPLPSLVSDYLIQLYGLDWMYIPPHNEQITHRCLTNIETPFRVYKSLIQPRTIPGVKEQCMRRKIDYSQNMREIHKSEEETTELEGEFLKRKIEKQLRDRKLDIEKAVEKGNWPQIDELFSDYVSAQTRKDFIGNGTFEGYYKKKNPSFIDIGDDYLFAVLKMMLQRDQISKVDKVLAAREKRISRPLSGSLKKMWDMLRAVRTASSLYESGKYDEAEDIVDHARQLDDNSALYKFKLILLGRRLSDSDACRMYEDMIGQIQGADKNTGDFAKLRGDYYFYKKDWESAFASYTEALLNTNNGIFLLQIKRAVGCCQEKLLEYLKEKCSGKYTERKEYEHRLTAWLRLFPESTELICLYIDSYELGLESLLNEECIYAIYSDPSKVDEKVYQCIADKMRWGIQNARFEIYHRCSMPETAQGEWGLETHLDVSVYQRGEYHALKGENERAYQCYLSVADSEDEYVRERVKEHFREDWERYITIINGKKIDMDFALKYKGFTVEKYITFLKQCGILPEGITFDNRQEFLSLFIEKNRKLINHIRI